jgi:hypothetical protein
MPRGSFGVYENANGYGAIAPFQEEYKPQLYRVSLLFFQRPALPFHLTVSTFKIAIKDRI